MSANSLWSRRHTVPIVSRRSGRVRLSRSFGEEAEPVLADLELVAVLELLHRLDSLPVEESSIQAAEILDLKRVVVLEQHCVAARDGDIVQEDVAFGRAADRRSLSPGDEMLAGASAAGAHDERRSFGDKLLKRDAGIVLAVLGAEAHRRLGPTLVFGK